MGNDIYLENYQNKFNRNLSQFFTSNHTKIMFWKSNQKDFFSIWNSKSNYNIIDINLFYYLQTINDELNIFLIGIFTKENYIDLNLFFNLAVQYKINISLLKILNDANNNLNAYFFLLHKNYIDNKKLESLKNYFDFINKIENTPNLLLLLYSDIYEKLELRNLKYLKENTNSYLLKSLCQIIISYLEIKNNNKINYNNLNSNKNLKIEKTVCFNILKENNNNINYQFSNNNFSLIPNNKIKKNGVSKINLLPINRNLNEEEEEEMLLNSMDINSNKKKLQNINNLNNNILENENLEKNIYKKSSRNNLNEDYSLIIENFLYLSNYKAASDINLLKKLEIKYIINCSGDYCNNVALDFINYLTLNLKDNTNENIECVFYKCYDFINQCKNEKKKILIHCYQGISRSVSIVISYLMINNKLTCDEAFNFVQKKRFIANPNLGFFLQLKVFEKRLFHNLNDLNNNKLKNNNIIEIFAICSFQIEQPNLIVARLIYHNYLNNENNNLEVNNLIFDKRGMFIICDKENYFIIQGSKIYEKNKEKYFNFAKFYIETIHSFENLISNFEKNNSFEIIEEGKKNIKLENLMNENNIKIEFGFNNNLDKYYIDLNEIKDEKNLNDYLNEKEIKIKKGFYFYPKNECYKILSLDDLNEDDYLISCFENENNKKIFIWKGLNCKILNEEEEKFKNDVIESFFDKNNYNHIEEIVEIPFEESDDFMELL